MGETCEEGACRAPRVRVAAGERHACALRGGSVWCWGANDVGQLGDGTRSRRRAPVRVQGIEDAVDVAVGDVATCIARASGKVACAGLHGAGAECAGTPACLVATEVLGVHDALRVTVGKAHACAVGRGGAVTCWGENPDGAATGVASGPTGAVAVAGVRDAVSVAAGSLSTCAVTRAGDVLCWGQSGRGRLGDGATVQGVSPPRAVTAVHDAIAVAASGPHTCALRRDGSVVCWGGRLDRSASSGEKTAPAVVAGVSDARELAVGAGETCVLRAGDGGVACWTEQKSASAISGLAGAVSVAAGQRFACAAAGGKVSCWGDNLDGTLGNGDGTWFPEPVDVEGIDDAVEVSTAEYGSCARRKSGKVSCWGGSAADARVPLDVRGLDDATRLFVGFDRVCATRAGGTPVCFSARRTEPGVGPAAAELGLDADRLAPRGIPALAAKAGHVSFFDRSGHAPVSGIRGAVAIDASYASACAARRGADVACWQWDQGALEGELHGKPIAIRPKTIAGTRDAIDVAMYGRACALLSSGKIACFRPEDAAATLVPGVDDATQLAAAGLAQCALHRGGQVSCWGSIGAGGEAFHGDGKVAGIEGAVSVGVASYHACVVLRSGKVRCWGSNEGGKLGRHELAHSDAPVDVALPAPDSR